MIGYYLENLDIEIMKRDLLSRVHNLQLDNKGTGSEFGPSPCIRENMKSKGSAGEYHEGIYVGINRI